MCVLSWACDDCRAARRGRRAPPASPRQAAPIDLTGYWVSVVIEDWKYRMVTPNKGVFDAVPLNPEGQQDRQDLGSGAGRGGRRTVPGVRRRRDHAHPRAPAHRRGRTTTRSRSIRMRERRRGCFVSARRPLAAGEPSWQGHSVAQWNTAEPGSQSEGRHDNLRPGYVRKNGAPYSNKAIVTEYFDLNAMPNGDQWLTVTTKVEDPGYFTRPYMTSSDFKKLPNAAGWNPTPCSAR